MNNSNIRYERKMHFTNLSADQLQTIIKLNSYGFKEIYSTRQVNSLYYDTQSFDSFFDNELNAVNRAKVRIRWYGSSLLQSENNANLEIKIKQGSTGDKIVQSAMGVLDGERFEDAEDAYLNYVLTKMQPVLLVSYQRQYFQSFDKKFRITLDSDVQYRKPNNLLVQDCAYQDIGYVLEFKYSKTLDMQAKKVIEQFPGRVTKFSKFARGMVSLYG